MSGFAGVRPLLRLALRRDRLMIPVWGLVLVASAVSTATSYRALYPSQADRVRFAQGVDVNQPIRALYGTLPTPTSLGDLTSWRVLVLGGALVAAMSVLLVIRHSRADEEAGRLELIAATGAGRLAPLGAAMLTAVLANLVIVMLVVGGLVGVGLPAAGSLALGCGWIALGIGFAALAALASQLAETSRGANTLTLSILGASYLIRAVADASGTGSLRWLGRLSPLGWLEQLRPYSSPAWGMVLLLTGAAVVLLVAALAWRNRRDLGAGAFAVSPGRPAAGRLLAGPFGLAWRLQRAQLLVWGVGVVLFGALTGSVAHGIESIVGSSGPTRDILARLGGPGALQDQYIATTMSLLGFLITAYGVLVMLRLRREEVSGAAEVVLSGAISRMRWAIAHLAVVVGGTLLLAVAGGTACGLAVGLASGDVGGQLPRVLAAALVQIPAAWVIAALAVVLFGALPRLSATVWGILGACLLLGQLGPLLRLPRWLLDASPFAQVPRAPVESAASLADLVLLCVAVVATAGGLLALQRRDIVAG